MRLIDADALEKSICQDKCDAEECGMTFERDGAEYCLEVQRVKDAPTIDAVSVGTLEQFKWERDVAIEQLNEIGKDLGSKMDDVATVVRCKDCKHYKPSAVASRKMCIRKDVDGMQVCYDFQPNDFCKYGERKEE